MERTEHNEALFNGILESSQDGIVVVDEAGKLVVWSKAMERICGASAREAIGGELVDVLWQLTPVEQKSPALYDGLRSNMAKLKHFGPSSPGNRLDARDIVAFDGRRRSVETRFSAVATPGGFRVVAFVKDVTERENALQQARDSVEGNEARMSALLKGLSDVVCVFGRHGEISYVSPSVEHVLGYVPSSLLGLRVLDFIHPEEAVSTRRTIQELIQNPRGSATHSIRLRHADGHWVNVEAASRSLLDHPYIRGVVVTLRDITERTRTQGALAESERRYRALFETSAISLWECDLSEVRAALALLPSDSPAAPHRYIDGNPDFVERATGLIKIVAVNEASRELFEGDSAGQIRESAGSIIVSHGFDPMRSLLHGLVDGHGQIELEIAVDTLKGNRRDVFVRAAVPETGSRFEHMLLNIVDLTGRKAAEEALGNFIAQSPEMIMLMDEEGKIIEFNAGAEELTCIRRELAIGMELWQLRALLTPDADRAPGYDTRLAESYREAFRQGNVDIIGRHARRCVQRPDGSLRQVEQFNFGIRTSRGMQIGSITHDVTDRAAAEQEIASLQEQVHQARKMEALGRLAGGVAHDFNNLLTSIIANADLVLLREETEGEVRETLEEIESAAYRAADLTQHLLAFSRKQVYETETIDLNRVVADMERMLKRIIGEDVRLEVRLEATASLVEAARMNIEQIVLNLAVNARDAMLRGGGLTIVTSNGHDEPTGNGVVQLSITDTGCGMPDEVKSHLFEPFFTTKEPGRGTGLGLATVYGIVQQLKGEIVVDSAPGSGTSVRVQLPLASADAPGIDRPDIPEPDVSGKETVLVAEDDDTLLKVVVKTLQAGGYSVVGFSDPLEALRCTTAGGVRIDLLIADMVMPEMSGTQLAAAVLERLPSTKVLFISGYAAQAQGEIGISVEGDGFLAKPFSLKELNRTVRKILDS
jgi:PAS domain S-box-containing protein